MFQIPLIIALFSSPQEIEQAKFQRALAKTIVENRMEYKEKVSLQLYQAVVNYCREQNIINKQHWSGWTNWYDISDDKRLQEAMACLLEEVFNRLDVLDTCPPIEYYKMLPPYPTVKMNLDELDKFESDWNKIKSQAAPWNLDLVGEIDIEVSRIREFWQRINSMHSWYSYYDGFQIRVMLRDLTIELNGDLSNAYSVPYIPWWRLPRR